MNIFINILVPIICLTIGYIFGSVELSLILGKYVFHQDPRDYGSHNLGATNCSRIWGKKVAFGIALFDMFKSLSPIYICWAILTFAPIFEGKSLLPQTFMFYNGEFVNYQIQWPAYWLCAVGAILGHCFPLFAKFKGGKGAATFMGIIIFNSWLLGFLIGGLTYLFTIKKSKYVSLAAIVTGSVEILATWAWAILLECHVIPSNLFWLPGYGTMMNFNYVYAIVITILAAVMIARHHQNISRLIKGVERKITDKKQVAN